MRRLHWKLTYGTWIILLAFSQSLFASSDDGTEAIIGRGAFFSTTSICSAPSIVWRNRS